MLAAWPVLGSEREATPWLALLGGLGIVVLAAGLWLSLPAVVPFAVAALGAEYALVLSVEHEPLDTRAAVVAAGLLLLAELAYWSLELRAAIAAEPGSQLLRLSFLLGLALGALALCAALVAVVDLAGRGGFGIELVGAAAAIAALGAIVVLRPRAV